jgi:hypothetical protein
MTASGSTTSLASSRCATIFEQNRTVHELWESSGRRRPLITIGYLGTLTGRKTNPNEEAYAAEREELEGLAVAQRNGINDSATDYGSALLRIVVANGGKQMRFATQAVEMIAELAERDPTIVAVVVGLVDSQTSTAKALQNLNRIGLPAIAPTLSADGFHRNSKLYLQLAPPNIEQARMLHEYATTVLHVARTRVYYTVGENSNYEDDRYVNTLVERIKHEFGDEIEDVNYFHGDDSLTRECNYSGMLLFAGRWSDFNRFLQQLKSCDKPPQHLVADDSVNRYMANPMLRRSAPDLPLTFVSKSQLGMCERLRSATAQASGAEVRSRFLNLVQQPDLLQPPRCGDGEPNGGEPVGERVPLTYDAAMLVVQAVERLAGRLRTGEPPPAWNPRSISPVAVYMAILGQNNRSNPFPGVTGSMLFDPGSGEPRDKRISILQAASIPDVDAPFVEVFHCGIDRLGDDPSCRQP